MVVSAEDYRNGGGVDPYEKYLKELNRKALRTKDLYLKLFNDFINWVMDHPKLGYDAKRLLEEHRKCLKAGKPDWVPELVEEWIESEGEKRGWKKATKNNPRKAIKLFFKVNGEPLNVGIKKVRASEGVDPMHLEDLKKFINSREGTMGDRSLRNKAIIMTLKDTGLRVSDLLAWYDRDDRKMRGFTVEEFRGAKSTIEAGEEFRYIRNYKTKKEGVQAQVHLGPESIQALRDYIKNRQSGPVFLSRRGKPLLRQAVSNIVRRCFADFKRNYSANSIRQMHRSCLYKMGGDAVKLLQGKAISGSDEPYLRPFDTDPKLSMLTRDYIDAYNEIRVYESESKSIEALKANTADLQQQLNMVKQENEQLQYDLKRRDYAVSVYEENQNIILTALRLMAEGKTSEVSDLLDRKKEPMFKAFMALGVDETLRKTEET